PDGSWDAQNSLPPGLNGTWRMEPPDFAASLPRVSVSAPVPVHPAPPPEPWPRVALSTPLPPRRVTDSIRPVPPPSVPPPPLSSEPFNGKGGRIALILGAISLVLSGLLLILLLLPSHGRLRVALVAEDTAPVARAEVFVDGEKKCDVVPCFINELGPGQKTI